MTKEPLVVELCMPEEIHFLGGSAWVGATYEVVQSFDIGTLGVMVGK